MFKFLIRFIDRFFWQLMVLASLSVIGMATFGFLETGLTISDSLYRSFQLFTLDSDPIGHRNAPLLNISRWVAMLVSVSAILKTVLLLTDQHMDRFRASIRKDHSIVIGAGGIGSRLIKDLVRHRHRVVVIENDPDNQYLNDNHSPGVTILIENARNIQILRMAGIHRARQIFITTNDDSLNTELLQLITADLKNRNPERKTIIRVHISDTRLRNTFTEYNLLKENNADIRVTNVYEEASRYILSAFPVESDVPGLSTAWGPQPHALFIGYTALTRTLITQLCLLWHFPGGRRPRLTIMDTQLERIKLMGDLSFLPYVADFHVVRLKKFMPGESDIDRINRVFPISQIFCSLENDSDQFLMMLGLKSWHLQNPIRTFYFSYDSVSFIQRLFPQMEPIPPMVTVMNVLDPGSRLEAFIDETGDRMAQRIHDRWLNGEVERFEKKKVLARERGKPDPTPKSSMVPWKELSEEFRRSNRSQADHLNIKLRVLNLPALNQTDIKDYPFALLEDSLTMLKSDTLLLEKLAAMEHARWNADKYVSGWRWGRLRDDTVKRHDNLVSYNELPDEIKQYDRDVYFEIPEVLKAIINS